VSQVISEQPVVWPIPQEMQLRGDALSLHEAVVVLPPQPGPADEKLARLFTEMVADDHYLVVPIVRGQAPAGKVAIRIGVGGEGGLAVSANLPGAEGYLLRVSADGVEAVGRDRRGAQYAIATLLQLAEVRGSDVVLRGAEIRDWPYQPVRMVHLFLPSTEHLAYARRYLRDFLLRYKFNGLFLETAGGVRYANRPEIAVAARRFADHIRAIGDTSPVYRENVPLGPNGRFQDSTHWHLAGGRYLEPDDLTHLCEWARDLDLDVVPEIQSLAHVYYLATAYREIAELQDADLPDAYCPSNPKSYEVLFDVMSTILDLTGCRSVHIGHDEWRAGGLCPACSQRDPGELLAEDVIKITNWLRERNQGVWMWCDHLIMAHDAPGHDSRTQHVWYNYPQTRRAGELLKPYAPYITMVNWSYSFGVKEADLVLADLGFKQIYGNFGPGISDWPGRSAHPSVLGAEVSSWVAWEDFELAKRHFPNATFCANMLWSNHWPGWTESKPLLARHMVKLRDRLRREWQKPRLWSETVPAHRKHVLDISAACNAPTTGEKWDLRGLRAGSSEQDGVPFAMVDPAANAGKVAVVVSRRQEPSGEYPHDASPIPVGAKHGSLIFWQMAILGEGRPMDVGESTNSPRETSHLLGWYEILYADGLTRAAEIRWNENVLDWNDGHGPLYLAREIEVGTRPEGGPLVAWGLEWTNPRPLVEIVSVTLRGAGATPETRAIGDVYDTRAMLLGLTAIELPRWVDFRPESEGKYPGLDLLIP
jgi:hypothetical protein